MTRPGRAGICLTLIFAGCRPTAVGGPVSLEAADPADRIRAIVATVRQADADPRAAAPALVDRLEDEDEAVRLFAIAALARLTGTRRGYAAYEPANRRRAAVERWREYLANSAFDDAGASREPGSTGFGKRSR